MRIDAPTIVYLHGFRSSPASAKAGQLRAAVAALDAASRPALFVPELSHQPQRAMAEIDRLAAGRDPARLCFVGSSLGGFYAMVAAERYGARAVLTLRQADVARHCGRSTATVRAWEAGRTVPPPALRELLAGLYRLPPGALDAALPPAPEGVRR